MRSSSLHGGTHPRRERAGRRAHDSSSRSCKGEAHFGEDITRPPRGRPPGLVQETGHGRRASPAIQDIVTDFRKLQLMDLERDRDWSGRPMTSKRRHDYRPARHRRQSRSPQADEAPARGRVRPALGLRRARKASALIRDEHARPGPQRRHDAGHGRAAALPPEVKEDESRLKHIPVILVTARSGSDMLNEGIEAGADDYIAKPFDSVELKARIRSLLRMRRGRGRAGPGQPATSRCAPPDLVERQRSLFLAMVKSLVSALEAKDKYTRDHSNPGHGILPGHRPGHGAGRARAAGPGDGGHPPRRRQDRHSRRRS